jgi:hypothetical protein
MCRVPNIDFLLGVLGILASWREPGHATANDAELPNAGGPGTDGMQKKT